MKTLRRLDRAMPEDEALKLLEKAEYGLLSTVSPDGSPYGVPVNYCMLEDGLYFHCALEGRKLENLFHEPRVSFCVVGDTEVVAGQFATRYESVIVSGVAEEVFADEKQRGLEGLLHKYYADCFTKGLRYIETEGNLTKVFRVRIEMISGKVRR